MTSEIGVIGVDDAAQAAVEAAARVGVAGGVRGEALVVGVGFAVEADRRALRGPIVDDAAALLVAAVGVCPYLDAALPPHIVQPVNVLLPVSIQTSLPSWVPT